MRCGPTGVRWSWSVTTTSSWPGWIWTGRCRCGAPVYWTRRVRVLTMAHLRAGWFVVLCAVVLAVSVWLPWLTTPVLGGGRASAIGGTVGSIVLPAHFGVGQLIVLLTSVLIV